MVDNHLDFAEALEQWCESVSGGRLDRHAQGEIVWHQLGILWSWYSLS